MKSSRGRHVPMLLVLAWGSAVGAGGCVGAIPGKPGAAGGSQDRHPGTGPGQTPTVDPKTSSPATGSAGVPAAASACQAGPKTPGPTFIRRLNRTEYNNTVRDLLGDTTQPATSFPSEEKGDPLDFDTGAARFTVSPVLAEQYLYAAEQLAAQSIKQPAKLMGCDVAAQGDACARSFIQSFGGRAWRRPMSADDVDDAMGMYTWGKGRSGALEGVRMTLIYFLESPEFFYRVEFGGGPTDTPGVVTPSSWEMASRLSYQLWNSMPDDTLFAAAKGGRLGTRDEIIAQARRMLADPRAADAVANFHDQWLQLGNLGSLQKDSKVFPKFSADLGGLFATETRTFLSKIVWEGDGRLATMLTAPKSYMNAKLAQFYGVTGPAGTTFESVAVDPVKRGGLLTQASFLALNAKPNQTSPVARGKLVREQLFCTAPPPPPPDVKVMPPMLDPKLTTRERFSMHEVPGCKECHTLMDPIGLGFENYDGIGQWRTTESGRPIDASGEIVGTDVAGTFAGVSELAHKLASSSDVSRCYASEWLRFSYGRGGLPQDDCVLQQLTDTLRGGGGVKDILLALVQTDSFLYAKAVVPGGAQ